MQTLGKQKVVKSRKQTYTCNFCHYSTSRKLDYEKHILTDKHQKLTQLLKRIDDTFKRFLDYSDRLDQQEEEVLDAIIDQSFPEDILTCLAYVTYLTTEAS